METTITTGITGTPHVTGIHHVTGIASGPKENLRFYEGVLGLRLVKQTVNFDDPGTYHLYYGDPNGSPGSILTFFPWQGAHPGRAGTGMTMATSFRVAPGAIDFWMGRFADLAIEFEAPTNRFGDLVLRFKDHDGLPLEIIEQQDASPGAADKRALPPQIPAEAAITGFHGVSLCVAGYERSALLLTEVFGYHFVGQAGDRFRFQASSAGHPGSFVDLLCQPDMLVRGRSGAGTIHHVAFRARDEQEQLQWREKVREFGLDVTPVLDRNYFRSIYFREPGGVLYEIATDPPGFAADEAPDHLGESLKLPDWLEPRRASIEARLPPLRG